YAVDTKMVARSPWRVSSTRVRPFGSASLLIKLRPRRPPNSPQSSLSEIQSPAVIHLLQSATDAKVASVAIFIRPWCALFPSPAYVEKILSKLARFWNPSRSVRGRDRLAWVVHGVPSEREVSLMQGGRNGTGEESRGGTYC